MTFDAKQLYEDLNNVYGHVIQRHSLLSERAGTLIGFDGLAAAILTEAFRGFVNTRATSLAMLVVLALFFHSGSAVLAIMAITERPWYVAPRLPAPRDTNIKEFFSNPSTISWQGLALQLDKAIELNEKENWRKHRYLNAGYVFFTVAVCMSFIIGFVTIMGSLVIDP